LKTRHFFAQPRVLAALREPELLRAMFDVGYFPPNAQLVK
jgi:hypothetical protein